MKFAGTLAKVVLAIVITVAIAGTAAAHGVSLELAQPLQTEIYERAPNLDMGIFPCDSHPARLSLLWNAFPEAPQAEFFERAPAIDMGIFPPSNVARIRSMEVAEPMQMDALGKCPTDAVKQPQQCDTVCGKNPTDAVKQPQQCDTVCGKNPTQAVRGPLDIECCGPAMSFNLKEAARTEVAIYNVNGRLVRRLSEMLSSGESSLTWDGMDDRGSRAASGVYFARVQANDETGKGKLVLVH